MDNQIIYSISQENVSSSLLVLRFMSVKMFRTWTLTVWWFVRAFFCICCLELVFLHKIERHIAQFVLIHVTIYFDFLKTDKNCSSISMTQNIFSYLEWNSS